MNKRKALSKSIRFEVFKRDKFTCQYCGRSVPDVVLHVDHIKPVAEGGTNEIINLITACSDCNLGKGKRELSDDAVVKKQQKQIQDLAEKNEQLEMYVEWRESLRGLEERKVDAVADVFLMYTGSGPNANGRRDIRKLLKKFTLEEIMDAAEISINAYYTGSEKSWEYAFSKMGGVCYNRKYRRFE